MKLAIASIIISSSMMAQNAKPTAQCAKFNPVCVQGSTFDKHLFQADALLRFGDAYTTHRTVFDGTGRFYEKDPIAPGQNHSEWMMWGFQIGAHVAIVQGHNLLVRHNHPKWARALVLADIGMEAYTVGMNAKHEVDSHPVMINVSSASETPITSKPIYR